MVTIREVAKLAGVGTSTVSRYFSKSGYISEDSASKIEDAIEQLNYIPNELARAMKSQSSKTIGLMLPTLNNPFFTELVQTIEQTCMTHDYKTVLCNTNNNSLLEKKFLAMAKAHCFDGVIFLNGSDVIEQFQYDIPSLILDRKRSGSSNQISIMSNHRNGAIMASEYLIHCGCKHIAYLTGTEHVNSVNERQDAFEEVMEKHGVKYIIKNFSLLTKEEKCSLLYSGVDGIFAWNDITAIEVLNFSNHMGIRIPEDIQLIGYDDIQMCEWVYPRLTTIHQPITQLGRLASESMIQLVEQNVKPPLEIVLENTLVIRETTKRIE